MWKTASSAVQGRRHRENDIPCQDKVASYSDEQITIIALADGAGSCDNSDIGAQITVDTAVSEIKEHFDDIVGTDDVDDAKRMLLTPISQKLLDKASEMEVDYESLSSTLLAVAVKNETYLIFHVGDGVIGYVKDDTPLVASIPFNGEFANETDFCTTDTVYRTSKIMKGDASAIKSFILMSDGSEATYYVSKTKSLQQDLMRLPRWVALFPQETTSEDLHDALENYVSRKTGDDCSITLMVRSEYASEAFSQMDKEDIERLFSIKEGSDPRKWDGRIKKRILFLAEAAKPAGCTVRTATKIFECKRKHLHSKVQGFIDAGIIELKSNVYRIVS